MLLLFFCNLANGQNFTSYFEPELELEYTITSRYSHSFGVENRNYLYDKQTLNYIVKQIDVSHFSNFSFGNNAIGLGIQYRFEESFDSTEENELRLMQEYEWKNEDLNIKIENRLRTEQRFYASTVKHRLRYELGLEFPFTSKNKSFLKTETESLFEIAHTQKPEFEQRLAVLYGFNFYEGIEIETGAEYRIANYTQDFGHELFVVVGINKKI
ncbi:DUF2490 domain-containing protein [Luteirhabdus pelagi]|uniref:DUF2490 domain-containing protein n=1 Tax=Luteirhabdus pelagi TaxID=2792783 RepID=UPI00193AD3AF|nr:DUF2490 domain-containing protein [Luteirhabdus pelagi]